MTRRGLFSLAGLAGIPAVKPAEPATITVRHPIPECLCGMQMMVLPYNWDTERRDARRFVCTNHSCENAGKVCVQTLYEVFRAEKVSVPPRDHEARSSGSHYGSADYSLGFRVTKETLEANPQFANDLLSLSTAGFRK